MLKRSALLAMTALSLTTAACDRKATGQSVAVVNGEEISAGELNGELQLANVPPSADQKLARQQLLQGLIDRRLLAQEARKNGIDKSPEFLTRQRRLTDDLLISMNAERQAGSQKLPDQAAVDAFIAQNPYAFAQRQILTLQQIAIDPPSDTKVLAPLADAHSLDAVAATLTRLKIPFTRATGKLDTGTVPPEALKRIFALPPTEPFVLPANGKLYANVITGREPVPMAQDDIRKAAVAAMRQQNTRTGLSNEVKQLRSKAKIEYQAGYAPVAAATPAAGAVAK
jgi:EpsD family peptidyl-prolyl cis-trans isomerase